MPITPAYQWSESESEVQLKVSIKQGTSAKLQSALNVCDLCVKINLPPYLLVLDLAHAIEYTRVSATVSEEAIDLLLPKVRRPIHPHPASMDHTAHKYNMD